MGGAPIDNEAFLQRLQQIYQGTRAWGTVRLQVKRLFEERHKYKKSKAKERQSDRVQDSLDKTKEFSMIVKVATPKRKASTVVQPNKVHAFEGKLTTVVNQALLKSVLEKQQQ